MREIEVRAHWPGTLQTARALLLSHGFRPGGSERQVDYIFDRPDGGLFRSGQKIRLRDQLGEFCLTYKSSMAQSDITSNRVEANIPILANSVDDLTFLLTQLGFPPLCTLPKLRHSYSRGDTLLTVDEWPIIGTIIEIEGPTERYVHDVAQELAPTLPFRNYRLKELVASALSRSGDSFAQAQFRAEEAWGMALGRLDIALGWDAG